MNVVPSFNQYSSKCNQIPAKSRLPIVVLFTTLLQIVMASRQVAGIHELTG